MIARKIVLLLGFLCLCLSSVAQETPDFESLLCASKEAYTPNKAFQMELSYSIYRASNMGKVHETHAGLYAQNDQGHVYNKMGTVELVKVDSEVLQINHEEKSIVYTIQEEPLAQTPLDMQDYAYFFEEVIVEKEGDGWKCTLTTPKPIANLPYEKVELFFDKQQRSYKQALYPLEVIDFGSTGVNRLERSVLIIEIQPLQPLEDTRLFKLDQYIKKTNTAVKAAASLNTYQFIQV